MQHGLTSADAGPASLGIVYEQLIRQSSFLAFMDCFRVIDWLNQAAFRSKSEAGPGESCAFLCLRSFSETGRISLILYWRPRRDLNPCYRRESPGTTLRHC